MTLIVDNAHNLKNNITNKHLRTKEEDLEAWEYQYCFPLHATRNSTSLTFFDFRLKATTNPCLTF